MLVHFFRYIEIPSEYLDFLRLVKQCITTDEKKWFICEDEFNKKSDIAFN